MMVIVQNFFENHDYICSGCAEISSDLFDSTLFLALPLSVHSRIETLNRTWVPKAASYPADD